MHRELGRAVREIRATDAVVIVYRGCQDDVTHCVSAGAAVLMNKPIICLIVQGAVVPEKLARVVDRFVEMRSTQEENFEAVGDAIKDLFPERFAEGSN